MRNITTFKVGGRQIELFVPSDKAVGARPIVFMQDGQNIFNPKTSTFGEIWAAQDAATFVSAKRPKPIVVAVWNQKVTSAHPSGRYGEYAPEAVIPKVNPRELVTEIHGIPLYPLTGFAYEDFMTKKVLPKVFEKLQELGIRYRTDAAGIAIAGSSMGGLSALNLLARYPHIFGTALSFSTHWTLGGKSLARELIRSLPTPESGARIWLDRGTKGIDQAYAAPDAVAEQELTKLGYAWPQVECRTFIGTDHNEIFWRERLPLAFQWWLDGMPSEISARPKNK
ncbi:MAG: hypothetical protein RL038_540 [Actinomycetota bacterium]|jgi:predicted alpha/beta superfamily hydrolase